ncbi:4-hydroxybenzoate synthetase (chorismate lyase) [Legionella massiliensis]|uniref:4-hydroxybenzoate synthetase (Chorismate lyase) n=1 Tax=Legionella massiliensis TaxID=1034943 RepID=A0A078L5G9_9GAMM|nr:chorismate lyase [Legionella massiliensis]CDZ79173.1 4-hydroxybenzoate synthetase (chorismate lyase) [Legionella massiliensis]CEE14911.1 Chorismate pyruvate-lyase [Legionella massiliensis]
MSIQINNLMKVDSLSPEILKPWLHHSSSLTDKLRTQSGDAELQVLKQSWSQPSWWDKFTLGLALVPVVHRDILMFSHKTACWFARTIIPEYTYRANRLFFDRLSQESLGVIVFNEPSIERTILLNYAINPHCLEYQWLPKSLGELDETLWLRLSVFTIEKTSTFYLVEIFLPGLMKVIN